MSCDTEIDASVLSGEQKALAARLAAMCQIVRVLADSEDRRYRGLKLSEIMKCSVPGVSVSKTVDDLVELKYVVRVTETAEEQVTGDLRVTRLGEVYGTTFFGRKWLAEQEKKS